MMNQAKAQMFVGCKILIIQLLLQLRPSNFSNIEQQHLYNNYNINNNVRRLTKPGPFDGSDVTGFLARVQILASLENWSQAEIKQQIMYSCIGEAAKFVIIWTKHYQPSSIIKAH